MAQQICKKWHRRYATTGIGFVIEHVEVTAICESYVAYESYVAFENYMAFVVIHLTSSDLCGILPCQWLQILLSYKLPNTIWQLEYSVSTE